MEQIAMHSFQFTRASSNVKTGPIPVTMTSAESCPTDCAFKGNGCYAETGPIGWQWKALSGATVDSFYKSGKAMIKAIGIQELARKIKALPAGQLWRHNQAGDLPGIGLNIDPDALRAIVAANRGKKGFTYTHKPAMGKNLELIRESNAAGFTINVSANSAKHAAAIKRANPDLPVVCVLPIEAESSRVIEEDGIKILVCPATRPDSAITCAACGLCQKQTRASVVGFPAHGARKKTAALIAA
jgi:hypothetical protein